MRNGQVLWRWRTLNYCLICPTEEPFATPTITKTSWCGSENRKLCLVTSVDGQKDNDYIPLQPPVILHDANTCFITAWTYLPLAAGPLPIEHHLLQNHAHDDDCPFLHDGSPVIRRNHALAVLSWNAVIVPFHMVLTDLPLKEANQCVVKVLDIIHQCTVKGCV